MLEQIHMLVTVHVFVAKYAMTEFFLNIRDLGHGDFW